MDKIIGFTSLVLTILLSVYGQIILKWQLDKSGESPEKLFEKLIYFLSLFKNPWIFSAYFAAFFASILWIITLRKFSLSFAYPFTSISFILVAIFSHFFLKENVDTKQYFGMLLIIIGLSIANS